MPTSLSHQAGSQWARMSATSRLGAIAGTIGFVVGLGSLIALWTSDSSSSGAPPSPPVAHSTSAPPRSPAQLQADREIRTVLAGAQRLRDAMKKPESFELLSATMIDGKVICYEYRARNSLNDRRTERYVVSDTVSSSSAADWNRLCAGKSGTDYSSVRSVM